MKSDKPLKSLLTPLLADTLKRVLGQEVSFSLDQCYEIPKDEKYGDLSSQVVFRAAKEAKKNPKILADQFLKEFEKILAASPLAGRITRVTVEGPGFLNFYYSSEELCGVLLAIQKDPVCYGKPDLKPKKILLEFVSANPTGPLTVAHGRQAALGDSLARILKFCGHTPVTEYYNNDEGVQINTLGKSTALRVEEILTEKKIELPENYYQGEYLCETARKLIQKMRWDKKSFLTLSADERDKISGDFAKEDILAGIIKDLDDFGVHFDEYYSQKALGHSGKVEQTLEDLRKKGVVYESEGALWFRSTQFGDDKDRVLIKSDKNYTYLTPDIAYHHEKFSRGFTELVNIWGPDHHGYIARLKASQEALGHDPHKIHILIAQLVTLYEGDKQVRMSTRAGEFVTLRQILDEVGRDAGRFFFLMRKFDAHLDFDLALAKSQTPDNPVFYIQYGHARIESIKALAREKEHNLETLAAKIQSVKDLLCLRDPLELRLLKKLAQFEDHVLAAERTLEPYRIVAYLMTLAGDFHRFYAEHRVVGDDRTLTEARLALVIATQTVLRTGLTLLGVSAPVKM